MTRLLDRLSAFTPTLVGTALLLFVGWLVALLLAGLARKLLVKIRLDSWLDDSELFGALGARASGGGASRLIARVVFWLVFLCVLVVALENLGLRLADLPVRNFIAYLPVFLGAILLLVGGVIAAAFLGRGTDSALERMGVDHHRHLGRLVKALVVALTIVLVIDQLGFDVTALTQTFSNLIVVVAAGFVLAFAWGGREVARNVLAGHYLRDQIEPGDRVRIDGLEGVVEEIGPLSTRLDSGNGDILVPNARLIEKTVERRREG